MSTANTNYPLHILDFVKNDNTEVGVVVCDLAGNPDASMLKVMQSQPIAAKMATGGVSDSDYEFPYVPVSQKAYAGGRGQLNIEDDNSKYADGHAINTSIDGHVFLCGQRRYGIGIRDDILENMPREHTSYTNIDDTNWLIQIPFTPTETFDIRYVTLVCARFGSPSSLTVSIHAGDGTNADSTPITSGILYEEDLEDELVSTEVVIKMSSAYEVVADTEYWIVIECKDYLDEDNYWRFYWTRDSSGTLTGSNVADFSDVDNYSHQYYFRLTGEDYPIEAKFFIYKGMLYCLVSYDTAADTLLASSALIGKITMPPRLFVNGDQGVASYVNGLVVSDDTKDWTSGDFKGATCLFFDGGLSQTSQRWGYICDNTSDTLQLESRIPVTASADAEPIIYNILNTDKWTEIEFGTGEAPRGKCTSVLVTHFCVYMAFGDDFPVLRMRRYRKNDDTIETEFHLEDQGFTFLAEAPNSTGSNKVWAAKSGYPPRVQYSEPQWANWEQTVDSLSWQYNRITANSSCEDTGTWEDEGSPTTNARSSSGDGWRGEYSWHVVTDADDEGSKQSVAVESGKTYNIACVVWVETLPEDGKVSVSIDGTVIDSTPANDTSEDIGGSWFRLKGHYIASSSGNVDAKITLDGGPGEFNFDEFEVVECPTYLEDLSSQRITNICKYGDPERLWVFTEGGLYRENMGHFQEIPLTAYGAASDDRNGRTVFVHDVNLMISYLNGLQSYYRESLSNVGPDREEGLPWARRGYVSSGVSQPSGYYISIDAGLNGYSSILGHSGRGYYEMYRAPKGKSIKGLFIESVPGPQPDKLWFSQGEDLAYIFTVPNPLSEVI